MRAPFPLLAVPHRTLLGLAGLRPRHSIVLIQPSGQQLGRIAELLEGGTLRPPRVGPVFPLEQAR